MPRLSLSIRIRTILGFYIKRYETPGIVYRQELVVRDKRTKVLHNKTYEEVYVCQTNRKYASD